MSIISVLLALLSLFPWCLVACRQSDGLPSPSPREVADLIVPEVINSMGRPSHINFGTWSYEGGNIVRGLWEIQDVFPDMDIEAFLHQHLNFFQTEEGENGWKLLNDLPVGPLNETVGFASIGDVTGLFPIGYMDRIKYARYPGAFTLEDDVYIVNKVVEDYIYGWKYHLEDGTISRPVSWLDEGYIEIHGEAVWVDDMFMGTALTTAWSLYTGDATHILESTRQILSIHDYLVLFNDTDSLYHHGFNAHDGHLSCCKWGRGNGWSFIAKMEALAALEELGIPTADYGLLLERFQEHAESLRQRQDQTEGGWNNILTNPDTFLETSCGAMFLTGFIKGVERGWLSGAEYNDVILKGWSYLSSTVEADGTISGIIGGTGIKNSEEDYVPDSTEYRKAGPGVGGVLRAVAAMEQFNRSRK